MYLYLICIFMFAFKYALMSFKFFFCAFKNNIVNLIQLVLIKLTFNIFICSLIRTYFLILLQDDFINCTVNNSTIILLLIKFISGCRILLALLSRPDFCILRTKFSQDLAFI